MTSDQLAKLIKSGMPKRQAVAMVAAIGEVPSGGAEDVLVAHFLAGSGEDVAFDWDAGHATAGDWRFANNGPAFLPLEIVRLNGTAMTYDADEFTITYEAAGVYLNYLYLAFVPGVGWDEPAPVDLFTVATADQQTLADVHQLTDSSLAGYQVTWMSIQEAGDTNGFPYIERVSGPNPLALHAAAYTSVRLLA